MRLQLRDAVAEFLILLGQILAKLAIFGTGRKISASSFMSWPSGRTFKSASGRDLSRRSLATNMLIRGTYILAIKAQLGYAFVETTMVYLQAVSTAMQGRYRLLAPSDL